MENLPALGVGMGFRYECKEKVFTHADEVDFLEITVEHFLGAAPHIQEDLALLQRHFTLIPHAINLGLGSADGVDEDYLAELERILKLVNPPWWSEHIALTRAGGREIGHLSPLPRTQEMLDIFTKNVARVKERTEVPLILENITYHLEIPGAEMGELEFLLRLLDKTDCGLLLDITNLFTNSANYGYEALGFLDALPKEKIVQFHFVGGYQRPDGMWIDNHSHATPEPVWELMEEALSRFCPRGIILERDGNFPAFSALTAELKRARKLWQASKIHFGR